jgi:DNA polymerase
MCGSFNVHVIDEAGNQAEWTLQQAIQRQRRAELKRIAQECAAGLDCPGATQVVPGEGNPYAAIVLLGEAPGEQEDRDGRPFVGRAGQLLDRMLGEAALGRDAVWITNAVKCRPVLFEGDRMRNRPPKVSEVRAWSACLHDELKLISPRVLVGLGAVAGRALLGPEFKLTQERGRWRQDQVLGVETLVTWHPAYLLRQKGEAYEHRLGEAIADLKEAASRLQLLSSP